MGPDGMCGILPQTMMALLIVEEQVNSAQTVHLHILQLPQHRVTLQYVTIPAFQENAGGRGQPGWSAIVTSNIMAYSSAGVSSVSPPHLPVCQTAPAQRTMGPHPLTCTPLGHPGNTSLKSLPIGVHGRHTTAITNNLKI